MGLAVSVILIGIAILAIRGLIRRIEANGPRSKAPVSRRRALA